MQKSTSIGAMQMKPASISMEEGAKTLKCEIKKLAMTKSETFSLLCEENVTYGEVAITLVGIVAFFAMTSLAGFLFGGEVL